MLNVISSSFIRICETNVCISVFRNRNSKNLSLDCKHFSLPVFDSRILIFAITRTKLYKHWCQIILGLKLLSAAFFGIFICCSLACVSYPQGPFCLSKGRCLQRQTLHSMHTLADDQHFYIPVCISILHAYAAHTTFILCILEHYMFY